jgi:hypothetical protein
MQKWFSSSEIQIHSLLLSAFSFFIILISQQESTSFDICIPLYCSLKSLKIQTTKKWCTFFYYCAGYGYIVPFTKVLTMYQIYHTWILPLHCSPLSPYSWKFPQLSFLHLHTCVYIVFTMFTLLPFSRRLSPPTGANFSPHNLFCSTVLWFCRRKTIKDKRRNMEFLLIVFS